VASAPGEDKQGERRTSKCEGVLPKSFGPCLDLGTGLSRFADSISRKDAATDANGSKTKKSFAYLASLREIELPRLHTLAELQTEPGLRPFGQRAREARSAKRIGERE
jgi:hypothetical protein